GQGLEDELHLGHLAEDVLAEALDVGNGELAPGPRLADIVLPALQCQVVVDLLRRTTECGQRNVTRILRSGDQLRGEERVGQRCRRRLVRLAEAVALADHLASLAHIARRAGTQAYSPPSRSLCNRNGHEGRGGQ